MPLLGGVEDTNVHVCVLLIYPEGKPLVEERFQDLLDEATGEGDVLKGGYVGWKVDSEEDQEVSVAVYRKRPAMIREADLASLITSLPQREYSEGSKTFQTRTHPHHKRTHGPNTSTVAFLLLSILTPPP